MRGRKQKWLCFAWGQVGGCAVFAGRGKLFDPFASRDKLNRIL